MDRFGPLSIFSTLKFERQYQIFIRKSVVMNNRKNVTKSLMENRMQRAVAEFKSETWISSDFSDQTTANVNPINNNVPGTKTKLPKSSWQHKPSPDILLKIFFRDQSRFCLQPEMYIKTDDGTVYGYGTVYQRGGSTTGNSHLLVDKGKKYVRAESLGHRIDFLSIDSAGQSVVVKGVLW